MENIHNVPCEKCGKDRKFRWEKKKEQYKNFRPLCAPCSNRGRKFFTKNDFTIIDTEEKAYSFGFFWADGCINRYKTFTVRLQEKDSDILDFFNSYFGGSRNKRKFKRSNGDIYFQQEWIIHDMKFIETLKKANFRENIDLIPLNLQNHFWRGLIDGDGCYKIKENKLNGITISSNYEDDFTIVKNLNMKYNISKYSYENSKGTTLHILGKKEEKETFVKWLYKDSIIYLKRKYNSVKKIDAMKIFFRKNKISKILSIN